MKSKLSLALLTTLAFAPLASADTEFRITGSTAFRSAVHAGLLNSFFTAAPKYGHSNAGGAISTASKSIWQGSVTGIAGTTTVRCTWSGSATGIQSVTAGSNVSFLTTAAIPASPGENPGQSASENLTAHAAFSDVGQTSTSFLTPPLDDTPVGVVVFSWVVNDTSATGASVLARYGFDNVTAQAARALYTTGQQPKALFTGNPADEAKSVFATGRDTGSGTRITMLAETKYGIFTPLSQFQITAASDAVTDIQVWPTTGSGSDALPGNGGYSSGGTLTGLLASKSDTTFNLKNAAGALVRTVPSAHLISCVGVGDAVTVVNGGGARLKYEGVSYDSTADDDKVRYGHYTMWGYQHFLSGTIDGDQTAAKAALVNAIDANVGVAGVQISTMAAARGEDGGIVGF